MLASSGTSRLKVSFQRSSAGLGRTTVHMITLFVLKHLLKMPFSKKEHVLTIFFKVKENG